MRPSSKSVGIDAVGLCANDDERSFEKVGSIVSDFVLQDAQLLIGSYAVKCDKINEIAQDARTLNMSKELMT